MSEHAERSAQRQAELDAELDAAAGRRRQWRPSLSPDEELKVADILRDSNFRKSIPGAEVQAKDVRKLKPGTWLNDEILNFYAVMLNKCERLALHRSSSLQSLKSVRCRI